MKKFSYTVIDELGLHARPAGMLVKEAKQYSSVVKIKKVEKEVMATQLFMLMSLGVKQGETVDVTIEGEDEDVAFEKLQLFFQENL